MADVGLSLDRAGNKKEEIKARADAIDELMEAGILEDLTDRNKDDIDRELSRITKRNNVEYELSMLKTEVGKGQTKTVEKRKDTEE